MIRLYLATEGVRFIETDVEMSLRKALSKAGVDVEGALKSVERGDVEILVDSEETTDFDQMVAPNSVIVMAEEVETGTG